MTAGAACSAAATAVGQPPHASVPRSAAHLGQTVHRTPSMRLFLLPLLLTIGVGVAAASAPARHDTVVVVRQGDNLAALARRFLDRSPCFTARELVEELRARNRLASDTLRPRQRLSVPVRPRLPINRPLGHAAAMPQRGIYLPSRLAGGPEGRALIERFVAAGGNAVVFDAKDRLGDLGYASTVPLAGEIGAADNPSIQQPAKLIEFLHDRKIHAVARLACYYDARLATVRPDLAPLRPEGGRIWSETAEPSWVDPSRPQVREYLLDLIAEVAAMGVDEIQLDYIRFPTDTKGAPAVFAFDPAELPRHKIITDLVAAARRRLGGSGVMLSAALFGVSAWGSEVDELSTGQRLKDLLPHLDVVSPMLYPSHFYGPFMQIARPVACPRFLLFAGTRRICRQAGPGGAAVRPWIQVFPYRVANFSGAYVAQQLRGAAGGGGVGWLLWNPAGRYDEGLAAMELLRDGSGGPAEADLPECPSVDSTLAAAAEIGVIPCSEEP
jgi:hypothetical protein